MESRRPRPGAPPGTVRGEEARGLVEDLRGWRLQDHDEGRAGAEAEETEGRSPRRSLEEGTNGGRRGLRSRGGRGRPKTDTSKGLRKTGRFDAREMRDAPCPRGRAACVRSMALQGVSRGGRSLSPLRGAAGGSRGSW